MAKDTLTKVYIKHTSEGHTTSSPNSSNSWDRADTSTSHYVEGITLEYPLYNYESLEVPFAIVPNKIYYLLYTVYSTGDSFGHDKDRSIDFIGLYENLAVAEENLSRIQINNKSYMEPKPEYGWNLLNMTGESEYKAHFPWNGYFESLSYAEILPCQSNTGRKRVTF